MRSLVVVAVGDPEIGGTGDDLSTWWRPSMRDLPQKVEWVAGEFEKESVGTGSGIGKGIEESAYVISGVCASDTTAVLEAGECVADRW